jgi:hypothetical protein
VTIPVAVAVSVIVEQVIQLIVLCDGLVNKYRDSIDYGVGATAFRACELVILGV